MGLSAPRLNNMSILQLRSKTFFKQMHRQCGLLPHFLHFLLRSAICTCGVLARVENSAQPQSRCLSKSARPSPVRCTLMQQYTMLLLHANKILEAFTMLQDVRQVLISCACIKPWNKSSKSTRRAADDEDVLLLIQVVAKR